MKQPRRNLSQDEDPNESEMNRYNVNTGSFRPYDTNLNTSRSPSNDRYLQSLPYQDDNNLERDRGRVYVNSYMTNQNTNRLNPNANFNNLNVVDNETYFQPNQQGQNYDFNEREEENENENDNENIRENEDDDENNEREDNVVMRRNEDEYEDEEELVGENQNAKKEEFYFQTKIRNTGFWGKVRLRRGTKMAIVGVILLAISIVVISVFWRWWYGNEINVPCRVIGITLLVLGFFSFLFGIISNCMMVNDEESKYFIGSPPRKASWILLGSIVALTVASDLITIYYTYWHTRYVNTPQIIVAIILYFFGSIAFIASLIHNFNRMKAEKYRIKYGQEAYIKKYKTKKNKKSNQNENQSNTDNENENQDENKFNRANDYESQDANPLRSANRLMNQSVTESETSGKKNFRKGVVRMAPRTINTQYNVPKYEDN